MIETLRRKVRQMRAFLSVTKSPITSEEQRAMAQRARDVQIRELARRVQALDSQTFPPEVLNGWREKDND